MIFNKGEIERLIEKHIDQILSSVLVKLDPNKYYILVVPENVPIDHLKAAFKPLEGTANIVVLQANGVKLLEIGGK